jgi:hypothetical protein
LIALIIINFQALVIFDLRKIPLNLPLGKGEVCFPL